MRLASLLGLTLFASGLASSADGPSFEAASVKLTGPDVQQPYTITGGPGTNDPGRFRAPRIGMVTLLTRAFDVSTDQIAGPAWLRDVTSQNYYTVVATIAPGATKEQFRKMLENLLIERFHLAFHRETRDFPGYELVVDKGGPKFKEVTPTQDVKADAGSDIRIMMSAPKGDDGFPQLPPGPRTMSQSHGGLTRTKYQERTMAEFVSNLGFIVGSSQGKSVLEGYLQPRVVDKTGLTGKYTFILEYYSAGTANLVRTLLPGRGDSEPPNMPVPAAGDPDGGPNIFVAIQKQLGLRLDKVAAVPLPMIVIDKVDKVPTPD